MTADFSPNTMPATCTRPRPVPRAFSLIELVIVIVIVGIVGAVAVPRLSRGSEGAAISALTGNMAYLNKALDLYSAEHGGSYPTPATIETQLLTQTNFAGNAPGAGEIAYGPYLRAIPPLPVGDRKGNTDIDVNDGDDVGWLYAPARGIIRPNLSRNDSSTDETLVTNIINNTKLTRDDLVKP